MSTSNENSYYEIALTHRQVLVSFVVLLGSVLLVFVAGIWVGRKSLQDAAAVAEAPAQAEAADGSLADLEEFRFPSDEDGEELDKPDLGKLGRQPADAGDDARRPPPPSTLAQQVGSAPPPRAAPPPPAAKPAPPPPAAKPPPPARAAPVATASAADGEPAEGFVIQVFSTRDEAKANKVRGRLENGGLEAFLSPVEVAGQTTYRVRIGPFDSREAAQKVAQRVTAEYKLDTWITAAGK